MDAVHGDFYYKSLRSPDPEDSSGPGGFLRLPLFMPGYKPPEYEHHNTGEESIYLDGDFFMPERGDAGTGTVHSNPGLHSHGPCSSQFGSYMLWHTLEPYHTTITHLPGGKATMTSYLASTPFFSERPLTKTWDQLPSQRSLFQQFAVAEAASQD